MSARILAAATIVALGCPLASHAEPAPSLRLETCAKVELGGAARLSNPNVAVKYVLSGSGAVASAEIHRSSGDADFDARIIESVRTCQGPVLPADMSATRAEQIQSMAISGNGRLVRGDRAMLVDASACAPRPQDYPEESRARGEVGMTTVSFAVDADGQLATSQVLRSSGHSRLDLASLKLISQCRFVPGRSPEGGGIGGTFRIDYTWKLD